MKPRLILLAVTIISLRVGQRERGGQGWQVLSGTPDGDASGRALWRSHGTPLEEGFRPYGSRSLARELRWVFHRVQRMGVTLPPRGTDSLYSPW